MHISSYLHLQSALALLQVDEEKEAKKMAAARAVLAGRSFTEEEDDPFEGLGPQEIQAYIDKALEGISQTDPFEVKLHSFVVSPPLTCSSELRRNLSTCAESTSDVVCGNNSTAAAIL